MREIQCFYLEPTDQLRIELRRHVRDYTRPCAAHPNGTHDARVEIGIMSSDIVTDKVGDYWEHKDQRWPTKCSCCNYQFTERDEWLYVPTKLFKRSDTGALITKDEAPEGAMMDADWLRGTQFYVPNTDGIILMVKTPKGWWVIDGPSVNSNDSYGAGWTRSGEVPNVTVTPALAKIGYCGKLTDGILRDL